MFEDVGGKRWGGGGEFIKLSDLPDLSVNHNTVLNTGSTIIVYGPPLTGFVFTNNLVRHNSYGIIGQDHGSGTHTLKDFFPGAVVRRNIIVGADFSAYPPDNFYPTKMEKVGLDTGHRLRADSPYRAKATDGTNVGCDFDALHAATAGVVRK